ncbi:uncharacterized protein LOC129597584 isoform X2 [Paramacrobiotus metropolitanus]|uniref:uncharacterized protein LOC129597584 isoform X2 n=1 Tax=Paramacrobiotus metropolitanus TaxID=2943436 RepID=UPI00244627B4|nr:uncharacterized protein LOC129597584 isoform X2 [Paramacrobiotus metropolitanus]
MQWQPAMLADLFSDDSGTLVAGIKNIHGGYQLADDTASRNVYETDLRNNGWCCFATLPCQYTINAASVCTNNALHIVSGHGVNGEFEGHAHRLDVAKGTWQTCSGIIDAPVFVDECIILDRDSTRERIMLVYDAKQNISELYAGGTPYQSHFAILDWDSGVFNTISRLSGISEVGMCSSEGSLVLGGGVDANGTALPSVHVGSVIDERLTLQPARAMAVPRGHHRFVSPSNGKVVAVGGTFRFGGRHSYSSCEMYDLHRDIWTFLPPLSTGRRNFAATSRDGCVFVAGGFNGSDGIRFDSEMLDLRMPKWIKGPDVPPVLWNYTIA